MGHYEQRKLETLAARAASRKLDSTRHKCFISYHADDTDEVATFLDNFGTEFIAKTIGVTDEDDFIDSNDTGYVMDQIRTKYLGDSSVTILLVGQCTWARRYVDWEIYSSLRDSKHSKVNGLLAIQLPSASTAGGKLPDRASDNVIRDSSGVNIGYARYKSYPDSTQSLRGWIGDAFSARTGRNHLIENARARRLRSASCS